MHFLKKNTVLKTISYINGISFCYFGSWLDADSYIPLIIVCVNILWFDCLDMQMIGLRGGVISGRRKDL